MAVPIFNLFKPNGISYSYQLDQSISVLMVAGRYFSFYTDLNRAFCKQTVRPWSDAAYCGVWSGFILIAYVPEKGTQGIYGLNLAISISSPFD